MSITLKLRNDILHIENGLFTRSIVLDVDKPKLKQIIAELRKYFKEVGVE